MSNPQQQRLIGKVIADRYRIVEQIGEGGMGAVYMAEHLTLHKQVALKVVHAEHAKNPELATRFSREAMATSRIEHPNVISAIDFGTLPDGTAYLAVQLVRGPTLTRVLAAEGPLPWARAVAIASQIADALSAAHGHGIVHRDLKPDNVLLQYLDDGGELVKVLDFGVAKFSGEANLPKAVSPAVTQIGFIVGTPGYMAPEQALGTSADERSDLYSLGVILWECIVGRPLWVASDLQRLVERQLVENPARLRASSPDTTIPPLLDDLVMRLLSRRSSDRPSDAAAVRDALARVPDARRRGAPALAHGRAPGAHVGASGQAALRAAPVAAAPLEGARQPGAGDATGHAQVRLRRGGASHRRLVEAAAAARAPLAGCLGVLRPARGHLAHRGAPGRHGGDRAAAQGRRGRGGAAGGARAEPAGGRAERAHQVRAPRQPRAQL